MSFRDFTDEQDAIRLLQRSLERGRLGHAYLFNGSDLDELGAVARTLAKTLNCEASERRSASGVPLDSCDTCPSCRKIETGNHPDVLWIRPESKLRVIRIEQIRDLLQTIYLKPTQAPYKVAILSAADRLTVQAANAFLKTLEEPPADSVLILLTTEPQRILETIVSRCLRLSFAGESGRHRDPGFLEWLTGFSRLAGESERSLLGRYRLLSLLLSRLTELKAVSERELTERSPLEKYDDLDPKLREKWEDELSAAVEAEYRHQRAELVAGLQWWLRDIWLQTMQLESGLLMFPALAETMRPIAKRLTPDQAIENLQLLEQTQRLLASNVQEALALEVGLLKLRL